MADDLTRFFYEVGHLKLVRRTGWWLAGVRDPESVADHSYRVALIAYVLATGAGTDPGPVVLAALFHDLPETRLGDLHRVASRLLGPAKGVAEAEALAAQLARLPAPAADPIAALFPLAAGDPLIYRLVKEADALEMLFQALEYQASGHTNVQEWIDSALAALQTEQAQAIAAAAVAIGPAAWFAGLKDGPQAKP